MEKGWFSDLLFFYTPNQKWLKLHIQPCNQGNERKHHGEQSHWWYMKKSHKQVLKDWHQYSRVPP